MALDFQGIFNWMLSLGVRYGYFGVFVRLIGNSLKLSFQIIGGMTKLSILPKEHYQKGPKRNIFARGACF
jgi:hypothetical protein